MYLKAAIAAFIFILLSYDEVREMPGDVVIRTGRETVRTISDREKFFSQSIMKLFLSDQWRKYWLDPDEEIFFAPYCFAFNEDQLPF